MAYLAGSTRLSRYAFIGLALIWAGGTSNLIDRVIRQDGLVTGFIFIHIGPLHTGVFNAADIIITIGMTVLVCDLWRKRRQIRTPQPQTKGLE